MSLATSIKLSSAHRGCQISAFPVYHVCVPVHYNIWYTITGIKYPRVARLCYQTLSIFARNPK